MAADPCADLLVALLVEDDPGDAQLIAVRLEPSASASSGAPVRVVHADSVAAACATLRQTAVDVVILDLSLPDVRGLEALHQVCAAASGVPVVVLAGTTDEAVALEALRAGAQDYVLKPPPDGATLRRILRYARERQHLLQELDVAMRASATAARRWRILAEVGKALAASHEPRRAITEVARLVVPDAADCFILSLVGDEVVPTVVEVAHVDGVRARELGDRVRDLLSAPERGVDQLVSALHTADAVSTGATGDAPGALLASLGVPSGVAVPLCIGGEVRGLVVLAATAGRRDAAADVEFGRSLADRIGVAVEQARLLRQMQRAVAARERAVGIVSHDLRNPLSTIQICATALLDPEPPPTDGMRHMAQIIQRSAAWMRQIVQDLLDRASLDAGQLALNRQPTAVSDVIGAAQVMFAPLAEEQALEFVVEGATDLPRVDADPHRLLQVLLNLLSNAMKFTPGGGRVVLSARVADDEPADPRAAGDWGGAVRFTVSDTGPGIPPEDLAHVFDWFWQSPRGGRSGTGLGLAIARGLIEAHRRRLHVESIPGRGSAFWFTVPTARGEGERCGAVGPRETGVTMGTASRPARA
jgi:signal transduction histidine kinase